MNDHAQEISVAEAKSTPSPRRRHYCLNCGEDIGPWDRFSDPRDSCGKRECAREERDAYQQEREDAHERLDRDLGYGEW